MKYQLYGQQGINDDVIKHYLYIIRNGIELADIANKVERVQKICDMDKGSIAIYYTAPDAFRSWLRNRNHFFIWMQGIYPEERRLRKNNIFDYYIVSALEYFSLRISKKVFMVSDAMLKYYEKKYKLSLKNKTFIMPCYNCQLEENSFFSKNKYNSATFCYVGSLGVWQCFDETVKLYKYIEQKLQNSMFYVFTKSIDDAEKILKKYGVNNYEVRFVPAEELKEALSSIKYGFIIRNNISINWVATPTKLSNYLANGIIPIFSKYIKSYDDLSKEYNYLLSLNNNDDVDSILEFERVPVIADEILKEYKKIFNHLYSDQKNIEDIRNFLDVR